MFLFGQPPTQLLNAADVLEYDSVQMSLLQTHRSHPYHDSCPERILGFDKPGDLLPRAVACQSNRINRYLAAGLHDVPSDRSA